MGEARGLNWVFKDRRSVGMRVSIGGCDKIGIRI